jgi:tRNA pseudouridine55 synthase
LTKESRSYDFAAGEVLLFDKPIGWTSFFLVKKVRGVIKAKLGRELKVGHAGTLDPLASGLMIVCTGKATKQSMELSGQDKHYKAVIKLGETTPSYDLETEPEISGPWSHITKEMAEAALTKLKALEWQTPPVFSAKHIDGKRAYKEARAGREVTLQPQAIKVHRLNLITFGPPEIELDMQVSKGTYVRTLAHDLGQILGCGAYLKELRRTASGSFSIKDATTFENFKAEMFPNRG